jgi:hypothetical protein
MQTDGKENCCVTMFICLTVKTCCTLTYNCNTVNEMIYPRLNIKHKTYSGDPHTKLDWFLMVIFGQSQVFK